MFPSRLNLDPLSGSLLAVAHVSYDVENISDNLRMFSSESLSILSNVFCRVNELFFFLGGGFQYVPAAYLKFDQYNLSLF